jgi:hypothetical protein
MKQEGSTSTPSQSKTSETSPRRDGTQGSKESPKALDFSKLDLTIDRVDERLSPSETNIFDK